MSDLIITKKQENATLYVTADGRVDTATSPHLDTEVKSSLDGIELLIMNFEKVSYISSSGLRVLLSLHKIMDSRGGKLVVKNPTEMVLEVFDVTGFATMLNVES